MIQVKRKNFWQSTSSTPRALAFSAFAGAVLFFTNPVWGQDTSPAKDMANANLTPRDAIAAPIDSAPTDFAPIDPAPIDPASEYEVETPHMRVAFDRVSFAPEGLGNVDFTGKIKVKPSGTLVEFEAQATVYRDKKGHIVADQTDNLVRLKYQEGGLIFDVTYHKIGGNVVQTVITTMPEVGTAIQGNVVDLKAKAHKKSVYEGDDYDTLAKSPSDASPKLEKSFDGKDAPRPYGDKNDIRDFSIAQKAAFYAREIVDTGLQVYGETLSLSSIGPKNKNLNDADMAFQIERYRAKGLLNFSSSCTNFATSKCASHHM